MPRESKQKLFVRARVKEVLVKKGLWKSIYAEYLELFRSLPIKDNKQRRAKAWKMIFEKYPEETEAEEAYRIYRERRRNLSKGRRSRKGLALRHAMPEDQVGMLKAIAIQRVRLREETKAENARQRELKKLETTARRKVHDAERLRILQYEKEKRRIMAQQEKLDRDEQIAAEVAEALQEPTVKVKDEGPTDVLRDVKWVYDNLADLIVTSEVGVESLDDATLRKAPSNGAIALAHYALLDRKAFIEKFVVKILPKDDGPKDEAPTEEEVQEELDPDFGDLDKYMKGMGE